MSYVLKWSYDDSYLFNYRNSYVRYTCALNDAEKFESINDVLKLTNQWHISTRHNFDVIDLDNGKICW